MKSKYVLIMLALALVPQFAHADDSSTSVPVDQAKKADDGSTTANIDDSQNNRAKTLEGSKSKFSGQLQFTYSGSSLDHPFSKFAPNQNNAPVPPVVSLSGLASARYRINDGTTVGVGTGITTQHPFQGPDNTTLANPYTDIARSFKTGVIRHYLDTSFTYYTDQPNHKAYGYNAGFTVSDEMHYESSFGLTAGLVVELDAYMFSNKAQYNNPKLYPGQTGYDYALSPYFEYALNKTFNLRSVTNIVGNHNRDLERVGGFFTYQHQLINQTLGLGSAISDAVFLYTYISMVPFPYSHVNTDNTVFGLSTIINLF